MKAAGTISRVLIPLVFCAASSIALAQSPDGPFYSKQHLIDFWASQPEVGQAKRISVNGYYVTTKSGFGPGEVYKYFQCSDGSIRKDCHSITGPFPDIYAGIKAAEELNGKDTVVIFLDGVRFPKDAWSPAAIFSYRTCTGDGTRYFSYVVLSNASTRYGDIAGMDCLPPL